jgi:membrane protein YqaA with SNARE-associated domain
MAEDKIDKTRGMRLERAAAFFDRSAGRPWFYPAAGAFPFFDYFLPFLPNQALLIALCAAGPQRWFRLASVFVLASALGAALTAVIVQSVGDSRALAAMLGDGAADGWSRVEGLVDAYGIAILALLALLPFPPRTAVLVSALAGLSPMLIALAVGIGRMVPVFAIAFASARAPSLIARLSRKREERVVTPD